MRALALVLAIALPMLAAAQGRVVVGVCTGGSSEAPPPSQPAPTVTTSAASSVTATSATLNGTANPSGSATTGWFRYATTNPGTCNNTFGTRAPSSGGTSLGSGSSAASYSQALTGLTPETTYYACAVAQNAGGTRTGAVQSFTTQAESAFVENGYVLIEPYLHDARTAESWDDIWGPHVATPLAGLGNQITVGYLHARTESGGYWGSGGGTMGGLGNPDVVPDRFAFAMPNFLRGGWDVYPPGQEQVFLEVPFPGTPLDDYTWSYIRLDMGAGQMKLDVAPPNMTPVSSGDVSVPTTGYARTHWVWFTNPFALQFNPRVHIAGAVIWDRWLTDEELVAQTARRDPLVPAWYEMDLRTSTFGQDRSGNNRHGTLVGNAPAQSPIVPNIPYGAP